MNINVIREEFPVTQNWNYLNHAAVAPLCRPAASGMRRFIRDAEENGMSNIEDWLSLYEKTRRSCARLIGARPTEIALLKNTTEGILTIANGFKWRQGDNIVLAKGEFPSNVYPWLNLKSRGVEVRWVEERDGTLHSEDFASAINEHTRLLSVSSVEFFSGYRNDIKALSDLCKKHEIFLFVDAIQSLGAFPIDVEEFGIDALAADAHKWLLGPEGSALFYCNRNQLPHLNVNNIGWASVESAFDFLSYDMALKEDVSRFENGTLNTAGIAGLKGSIDFIIDQGITAISERIIMLTDLLYEGLIEKGYQIKSSRKNADKSGIITFKHPQLESQSLVQALKKERIIGTERGNHIRLSPHFYNIESEIESALRALPPA